MYRLLVLGLCLSCATPYVAPMSSVANIGPEAKPTPIPAPEPIITDGSPRPKILPTAQAPESEPPKEPRPEKLGTAPSSKKARPTWSSDPDYAPQYGGEVPERVIEAAQFSEALLVCDVDASGVSSQDFFGGKNEIGLSLKLGKSSTRGDFKSSSITAPLVSMKTGDSFTLGVYDLDYISDDDPIEFIKIKYKGEWPISADGKRVSYRCYAALREDVEGLVTKHLAELEKELLSLEKRPPPDLFTSSVPEQEIGGKAKQKVETLASLVGWDDPSVVARISRINALEEQHKKELQRATTEALASAYPMGQNIAREGEFSVTPSLQCNKKNAGLYKKFDTFGDYTSIIKKTTCVVELRIENKGAAPINSRYYQRGPFGDISALNAIGAEIETTLIAVRTEEGLIDREKLEAIQAGQTVDFIFAIQSSQLNTKKPTDKTPLLLRLVLEEQKLAPFVWYVRLRDEGAPAK